MKDNTPTNLEVVAIPAVGTTAYSLDNLYNGKNVKNKRKYLKEYGGKLHYFVKGKTLDKNLPNKTEDELFSTLSDSKVYRKAPKDPIKGNVLVYLRQQYGLDPSRGNKVPELDNLKVTGKIFNNVDTYKLFENKYEYYKNFKNPEKFMPKTRMGNEFKGTKEVYDAFGDKFVIKDLTNTHGLSFKQFRKGENLDKYLKGSHLIQEKIPIKSEFRVHALGNVPYYIKTKQGPKYSIKNKKEIFNFVTDAINNMKTKSKQHHAFDIALTAEGKLKVIEDNAASGNSIIPKAAKDLKRLMEKGKLPLELKEIRNYKILAGVSAATVGIAGISHLINRYKKEHNDKSRRHN